MNKVFNVNLGGYPFTIDDVAYEHLSNYLETIHNHFSDSEGYEEITSDIEARMAELFQERLGSHEIVSLKDVNAAISIMGTPEDFGAEPIDTTTTTTATKERTEHARGKIKFGKRLFKNPDDAAVGGVCSGLASYFGIEDPLWVRLAFLAIIFLGGSGVLIYLILWAILPEAKTASDRLAMKGEPINVNNIGKIIEDEIEFISTKVTELGNEFGSKKKSGGTDRARATLKKGFSLLGRFISTIFSIVFRIWKPIIFVIGILLIIALIAFWIGLIISFIFALPHASHFIEGPKVLSFLGFANVFFIVGVPMLSLILICTRLVTKRRLNPYWSTGMWSFWVINIFSLVTLVAMQARNVSSQFKTEKVLVTKKVATDTLSINTRKDLYSHGDAVHAHFGDVEVRGDQLVNKDVAIDILQSEDGEFGIYKRVYSRGLTTEQAELYTQKVSYNIKQEDDNVTLDPSFLMTSNSKYRGQHVQLTLRVPKGKYIKLDERTARILHAIDVDNYHVTPRNYKNKLWRMEDNGLVCMNCSVNGRSLSLNKYQNFSNIIVDGRVKVYIEKGDFYKIELKGKENYEKIDIDEDIQTHTLSINSQMSEHSKPARIYVTMPSLESIKIENTHDIKITGFDQEKMSISNSGKQDVKAIVNVRSMEITQEGRNEIDLIGTGKHIKAIIDNRARLDAKQFSTATAEIIASDKSTAIFSVTDTIKQYADPNCNIRFEGTPVVIGANE